MTPAGDERGSAVVELAILTPTILLLLMLVVAAGRLVQARNDVYGAAADAARAVSIRQRPADADADARRTAARALADRGVTCRSLTIGVDASALSPGGTVSVVVTCSVDLSDLGLLGVPGSRSVTARAFEVVDRFRGS